MAGSFVLDSDSSGEVVPVAGISGFIGPGFRTRAAISGRPGLPVARD